MSLLDYIYAYSDRSGIYVAVEVFPDIQQTGNALFAESPSDLTASITASAWGREAAVYTHEDEELANVLSAWLPNVRHGRPEGN